MHHSPAADSGLANNAPVIGPDTVRPVVFWCSYTLYRQDPFLPTMRLALTVDPVAGAWCIIPRYCPPRTLLVQLAGCIHRGPDKVLPVHFSCSFHAAGTRGHPSQGRTLSARDAHCTLPL